MGASEYASVRSQRELLAASTPNPHLHRVFPDLDIEANELALFYRSRGMDPPRARSHARVVLSGHATDDDAPPNSARDHEAIGTGMGAPRRISASSLRARSSRYSPTRRAWTASPPYSSRARLSVRRCW